MMGNINFLISSISVAAIRSLFGRPLPARQSTADPALSMRRPTVCTELRCQFPLLHGICLDTDFPCSRNICILILSATEIFPISSSLSTDHHHHHLLHKSIHNIYQQCHMICKPNKAEAESLYVALSHSYVCI